MLGPHLIGRRVVVRRRAGLREGRQQYTDVLGELTAFGDGMLRVRRADGESVEIRLEDVVAGKEIPPRRRRT